jgi:hypothetical protein
MALLLILALLAGPTFDVRASPRMGLAVGQPNGDWCLPVLLTAEIRGPETPELYCPRVEWRWPDGTVTTRESDCPPFEARDSCVEPQAPRGFHRDASGAVVDDDPGPCTIIGYPRRWTQAVCLPGSGEGETRWEIEVWLSRAGKVLRRGGVTVLVH